MKKLRALIIIIILFVIPSHSLASDGGEFATIRKSLVKIYTRTSIPDVRSPWQSRGIGGTSGSGVIIEGNYILTNAHVVANQVNVEVKRDGLPKRFTAKVLYAGHDCDLALLTVDDEAFFDGSSPMALGMTPDIRDSVTVYGFPLGGESVSVTSGIVSRIEVSRYAHSGEYLLLVQIDAAINAGNSGGPVVSGGKIAGIASQSIRSAENVGYMIPADIILHFLKDVEDGSFDGFPSLGISFQPIENDGLKESLDLKEDESGVLVNEINFASTAWGVLEKGDVLLQIDGISIAEDLSVPWREKNRVHFSNILHRKQLSDKAELKLLRKGKIITRKVTLKDEDLLILGPLYDMKPSYYILGGLVFQPLDHNYMRSFKNAPPDFSYYAARRNMRTEKRGEVLLLAKVLATPFTRGYHGWNNMVLSTVQGEKLGNMEELVEILERASGKWLELVTESGGVLVLDLEEARAQNSEIMNKYGIPADRSVGLLD